jgi:hypothetical protein
MDRRLSAVKIPDGCPNFAKGVYEDPSMRILIAAMAMALMTVSAHAQGAGGGRKHRDTQKAEDSAKTKADDQAYKDALKRIPVPSEKPDPWKSVR